MLALLLTPILLCAAQDTLDVSSSHESQGGDVPSIATGREHELEGRLEAHVMFATEYLWRGVSQTKSDPAVQGAMHYRHQSGLHGGIWGSNVDFRQVGQPDSGADIQLNYVAGYGFLATEGLDLDVSLTHRTFPGTANGEDSDWTELGLHGTWDKWLTVGIDYSHEALASEEPGIHYSVRARREIEQQFSVYAGVGVYDLDDVVGDAYAYYSVGVTKGFGSWAADLSINAADGAAESLFGRLADDSVLFTIRAGL